MTMMMVMVMVMMVMVVTVVVAELTSAEPCASPNAASAAFCAR
jgi:hypothetical protein